MQPADTILPHQQEQLPALPPSVHRHPHTGPQYRASASLPAGDAAPAAGAKAASSAGASAAAASSSDARSAAARSTEPRICCGKYTGWGSLACLSWRSMAIFWTSSSRSTEAELTAEGACRAG